MTTIAPCTHGKPAKYVTVVDQTRVTERDPYGDIAGPMNAKHTDAMEIIRAHEEGEHSDEPGRFVLGFIHVDGCRSDNSDTDPTTRITDPAVLAAAVAEGAASVKRSAFYLDMTPDEDGWFVAFVQHSHPAVFDAAAEHIREWREKREGARA